MMTIDLRLGRWQDVLADVERCDVILTDPPYSERTHRGYLSGSDVSPLPDGMARHAILYDRIATRDQTQFVTSWKERVDLWSILFGDDASCQDWKVAWEAGGWCVFAAVIWLKRGAPPRFNGDGPASQAEHIAVARPRRRCRDAGSRSGFYLVTTQRENNGVIGTKDVAGLKRILYDYTRPGDLVVDPWAGTATVGQACIETGRSYIGAEMDPRTYELGQKRLHAATPCIPGMEPDRWATGTEMEQSDLFGGES